MMTGTVKKGFSLIEILIAIAIMGVIAVGAVQYLGGKLEQSRRDTTATTLQVVDGAIDNYHLDIGKYPETLADLSRKPYNESAAKKWTDPYLKQAVKNPEYMPLDGWGEEIQYDLHESGSARPYELYSFGKNGQDAPEDEWIHAK